MKLHFEINLTAILTTPETQIVFCKHYLFCNMKQNCSIAHFVGKYVLIPWVLQIIIEK